jgi:hypothetical protein
MPSSKETKKRKQAKQSQRRTRYHIPKSFRDALNNRVKAKKSSNRSNECPICIEKMAQNNIVVLPCGHKFHFSCIYTVAANNGSCPLCRAKIFPLSILPSVTIEANGTQGTLRHDVNGLIGRRDMLYEEDGTPLGFSYQALEGEFTIIQ